MVAIRHMGCRGTGHTVRQADHDTAEGDSRVDFVEARGAEGSSDARANDASISSWVRFLDLRNSMRFSTGEAATDGSRRNVTAEETRSSRRRHDSDWSALARFSGHCHARSKLKDVYRMGREWV